MRVTLVRSTSRIDTQVMRRLDGDQRGLVVLLPWDQTAIDILTALAGQLTEVERVELAAALTDRRGHELA